MCITDDPTLVMMILLSSWWSYSRHDDPTLVMMILLSSW